MIARVKSNAACDHRYPNLAGESERGSQRQAGDRGLLHSDNSLQRVVRASEARRSEQDCEQRAQTLDPRSLCSRSKRKPRKTVSSPNPAISMAQMAAGSTVRFPRRKRKAWLAGSAPSSGSTTARIHVRRQAPSRDHAVPSHGPVATSTQAVNRGHLQQ